MGNFARASLMSANQQHGISAEHAIARGADYGMTFPTWCALAGVCAFDAISGSEVEVTLVGVWELPKATGAITESAIVWWDNTTNHNVVAASAAGLFPIGVAVQAAGSSDATVRVRLSGVPAAAVA
jgi:predicted RecA/RadA family phage recombinase